MPFPQMIFRFINQLSHVRICENALDFCGVRFLFNLMRLRHNYFFKDLGSK